ncbi:hypothetical protein CPB84DRAFT_1900138 [Gymnopilus junonius]|uniref:Uncharacterized protein n=1 Tax=Gymnopilus junonius TaxID=109634 RepID=A0A9P5NSF1_GYMJU|nr:hypothetical protein CPB84DRAFT_1900138 [Gymnopilus junonius]
MMAFVNFKASLLLLLAVFQCALFASARPQHLIDTELSKRENVDTRGLVTNAKRLRAGLGPLKPRTLYSPSRVAGGAIFGLIYHLILLYLAWSFIARDPQPSTVLPTGNVVVRRADGSQVGYLSTQGFGLVTTQGNNMEVSFNPNNSPFNVAINGNQYPYLGFVGTTLATNAIGMGATNPTLPGSTSQVVGTEYGATQRSESSVWYYSAKDHKLTAQWVNPDGSVLFPGFVYVSSSNRIGLDMAPGSLEVLPSVNASHFALFPVPPFLSARRQ